MGCCDFERKPKPVKPEHKFSYINLRDFRSKSCLNYMAYFGIYAGTVISIACYVADIYTAVILLVYNRWSSETLNQTTIVSFGVAKIVFCTCISLSFALLSFDWWIAVRILKSDGVADAYLNVIAVRFNCIRGGKGKDDTGWKRFLVFSRLTASRGIMDYIAIFTYFAFKGWIRIIFAEGPRVVINTLTFISVTRADDIVKNQLDALSAFEKFFSNFSALYQQNKLQVIVLGTMAFTTLIWVFAIIRLLIASLIYLCYLWHAMGGRVSLHKYCKERIDTRMGEIVQKKHDKALAREKKENALLRRQPTIPIQDLDTKDVPSSSPGLDPDATSSTVKLIPGEHLAPPITSTSSVGLGSIRREPTIPKISQLDRVVTKPHIPAPQYRPSPSPAPSYHSQTPPFDHTGRQMPVATHIADQFDTNHPLGDHPYYEPNNAIQGHMQRDPGNPYNQSQGLHFQMQQLPSSGVVGKPFVTDRIARSGPEYPNRSGSAPPMCSHKNMQENFPVRPQAPEISYTQEDWTWNDQLYERSHTHMGDAGYGRYEPRIGRPARVYAGKSTYQPAHPQERSQTTGPPDSKFGTRYLPPRPWAGTVPPPNHAGTVPLTRAGTAPPNHAGTVAPTRAGSVPPRQNYTDTRFVSLGEVDNSHQPPLRPGLEAYEGRNEDNYGQPLMPTGMTPLHVANTFDSTHLPPNRPSTARPTRDNGGWQPPPQQN